MDSQKLNTILFDLDGTLLPLDQKQFVSSYFSLFVAKSSSLGYDPHAAAKGLAAGLTAMIANDGSMTNKQRFEHVFEKESNIAANTFNEHFVSFYDEEFCSLIQTAAPSEYTLEIVETVKAKGYSIVLATTPLFPWQGTYHRIAWAGLKPELFDVITTYEDFSYAKPHKGYYQQILTRIGRSAQDCLMIGNDVKEDMVAQQLGMQVYLVTDCLINEENAPIQDVPKGSLSELLAFCKDLAYV